MLVWFMHGASVRQVTYADRLRSRLIADFSQRGLALPEFYSCFWGDVLGSTTQLWDWVQQDLEAFRWEHPQIDPGDIFHYSQRREQLISGFFNDIFNYLNSRQGKAVRKTIAIQFLNCISEMPFEEDLHIVAHSLGSVILWDMLFSDAYGPSDPAFYLRKVIKGLAPAGTSRTLTLRSITTLGSPLLFFNRLLDIDADHLKQFADRYRGEPLRWVNVINASDIFAYPLRANLELMDAPLTDAPLTGKPLTGKPLTGKPLTGKPLYFRDQYLGDRNFLKKNIGDVAMALGLVSDHSSYWKSRRVARLVLANLLGDTATLDINGPILDLGDGDE
jgi:hypothetical protein